MRRAAILFCIFAACFGPFNTAGEATNFMASQKSWVVERSNVIPDDAGFDAILTLKGTGNGSACAAVVNGGEPLCPQSAATMDENGVVRQQ